MPEEHGDNFGLPSKGEDKLETAERMVQSAFLGEGNPLAFIQDPEFVALVDDLRRVYEKHNSNTKEFFCSICTLLMQTTPFGRDSVKVEILHTRSKPIMRQLVHEHKTAPEVIGIICSMIMSMAMYSSETPE